MSRNCYDESDLLDIDMCEIEDDFIQFKFLQHDAWKKEKIPIKSTIMNCFDEYLAGERKDPNNVIPVCLGAGSLPPETQAQRRFALEKYKSTDPMQGLSVVFTISFNKDVYCMCATSKMEISFKKESSPESISGSKSEIVFFTQRFSPGHAAYKFESSLFKDYFLAIKEENNKRTLYLKKPIDEVDEMTKFNMNSRAKSKQDGR
ncbi:interleukin-18 [Hyperolius riggenbachi]|uniref:interleukin-18 n=1 Tax=Hyperolius riggenbachi TaxID=752182 RepID=UPI0035A2E08C